MTAPTFVDALWLALIVEVLFTSLVGSHVAERRDRPTIVHECVCGTPAAHRARVIGLTGYSSLCGECLHLIKGGGYLAPSRPFRRSVK
jgi:hypothetical protein